MQREKDIDILIVDFLSRNINSEDLHILNEWVNRNQENRSHFEKLKSIWMLSSAMSEDVELKTDSAYKLFVEKTNLKGNTHKRRNLNWVKYASYAAIIALLIISAPFIINKATRDTRLTYTELNVPRGAKSKMILPDSTIVWINADSKLIYSSSFGKKDRNVTLLGEAYFDVRPGEKAFIVSMTDFLTIKVLGTKFNVSNYDEDSFVKVSLLEGKVLFSNGEEHIFMHPSQTFNFNKENKSFSEVNTKAEYANQWINNRLFFDEMSFVDVAIELERLYDIEIIFDSEDLKDLIFYGDFFIEANNLDEILQIMSATNKFKYKYQISHNKVYISKPSKR